MVIPSQPKKKASEILPLTLLFLILQTAIIILMAWEQISESRGFHDVETLMEAVYPISLAVLIVLFCLYAFSKERQGLRLSTSVLELTTLARSVVANAASNHHTTGPERESLAPPVLRAALEMMGVKHGALFLLDESSGSLTKIYACDPGDGAFAAEEQTAQQVAMSGVSITMSGSTGDPRVSSAIFVPLKGKGLRGVLSAYTTTEEGKVFARHDASLADLVAQYASLVMEQTRGLSQPSGASVRSPVGDQPTRSYLTAS